MGAFKKIASSKLTLRHVNLIKRWMDFAMCSTPTMCWMRIKVHKVVTLKA